MFKRLLPMLLCLSLLICYPKEFPATSIQLNGTNYLAFEYPNPATNVVAVLINYSNYTNLIEVMNDRHEAQLWLISNEVEISTREYEKKVKKSFCLGSSLSAVLFVIIIIL